MAAPREEQTQSEKALQCCKSHRSKPHDSSILQFYQFQLVFTSGPPFNLASFFVVGSFHSHQNHHMWVTHQNRHSRAKTWNISFSDHQWTNISPSQRELSVGRRACRPCWPGILDSGKALARTRWRQRVCNVIQERCERGISNTHRGMCNLWRFKPFFLFFFC